MHNNNINKIISFIYLFCVYSELTPKSNGQMNIIMEIDGMNYVKHFLS